MQHQTSYGYEEVFLNEKKISTFMLGLAMQNKIAIDATYVKLQRDHAVARVLDKLVISMWFT